MNIKLLEYSITNSSGIKLMRMRTPLNTGMFSTGGADNVCFRCTRPPENCLIHIKDLIHPDELKKLKFWDDYVLLRHTSKKVPIIKTEGLKCYADINPELAELRKGFGFSNDPDLIYFSPITPNNSYKTGKDSIVIAVPKNVVRVFNQEERASRNFAYYYCRSMPVEEYYNLLSKLKPGECLQRDKQIVLSDKIDHSDCYIPEVCFADRYIPPEYFI